MDEEEKLEMLKAIMEMPEDYTAKDKELLVFLKASKKEILNWLYSGKIPEDISEVPSEYEMTQIWSVVAGYNLIGAENQICHLKYKLQMHKDKMPTFRQMLFLYNSN